MKNRHKYLTTVLIFVFVTTFIACVLVLTNFIKQPTSYPDANNQSELNKVIGEQYLFTEIPNFDRLNLEDLPNISDNLVGRSAIIFNENLILSSGNKILEYNPKIKQFIRVSNKILPDISKPAIIGDNLYVAGGNLDKKERDWPGKSVIYTIDLKTGKIIKVLLSKDPRNFANLNIVARDGYLWAGSLDGTFKINPDNDTLTALTIKDDFYNPYLNFENGTLVAYDRGNRFEYDNGSQVWNEKTVNQSTYTLENNLDEDEIFNNLKLKLPSFSSISPIIRNKYYLFSDKGIFTLERGRFPKQVIEGKIEENEYFTERLFVTEDEKHA